MKDQDPKNLLWSELIDLLDPNCCCEVAVEELPVRDKLNEAWREVHDRLKRMAGNSVDADIVVEEILAELFRPSGSSLIKHVRKAKAPEAYIRKTIKNRIIRRAKQSVHGNVHIYNDAVDVMEALGKVLRISSHSPWDAVAQREAAKDFAASLENALTDGTLKAEDYLLLRRKYEGVSIQTLASEYQVSYAAMAQRLHRALERFMEYFRPLASEFDLDARLSQYIVEALDRVVHSRLSD